MAYDYSRVDRDGLRDHFRDAPYENIFKLGASAAASEFFEWGQAGIHLYIPLHIRSSLTNLHSFQLHILLP